MLRLLCAGAVLLATAACAPGASSEASSMTDLSVSSAAFDDGGTIPRKHGCDGEDVSPPLAWSGAPSDVAAFALIVHDPDANGFVHWTLADIPSDVSSLDEGESAGVPGRTSFGQTGYGGPCPPSGTHRYRFEVFALSEPLGLSAGFSADELRAAMEGRVLGSGTLTGSYSR